MGLTKVSEYPKPFDKLGMDFAQFAGLYDANFNINDEMIKYIDNQSSLIKTSYSLIIIAIIILFA